jgi:CHAT domain-containing protein/tetratricopeptide (TPR) repeat protein
MPVNLQRATVAEATAQRRSGLSSKTLATLSRMTDDNQRGNFLRSHDLLHAQTVHGLNEATQKELHANTKNALSLARAAVLVARHLRDNALLAQCYRVEANVLSTRGEYQSAIDLYNVAFRLFGKTKDTEGAARTLTAIIQPYIMAGAYDRAFEAASQAQSILVKLGDGRRLARLENNIGNIYHRQDKFPEAIAHYKCAYQDLLPYGDCEEITISLNNMAMCLISTNDFSQALSTYEQASELLQGRDLPLIELITDYNIAYLYYMRGDYSRAIEMLKSARVDGERIGYDYLVALCCLDLSDIYVELNLCAEATEAAEKGHELFQKLQIGYEAAKTLANQAIVLGQEGKAERALELFAHAQALFVKEKNSVWPWLIDLYEAVILLNEGRHREARALATGAANFFDSSSAKNKAALCHVLLAQIAFQAEEAFEARAECSRALDHLRTLEFPELRFQCHFLLGQIEHARGDLPAAYGEYQRARTGLENLRANLSRDDLKISFMKNKIELYERLVELCLNKRFAGASQEEAFRHMEMAKSRSLTESMTQGSHGGVESEDGNWGKVIRDMRQELSWYQHRIEQEQLRPEASSASRIEKLSSEARDREAGLLKTLRDLPENSAGTPERSGRGDVPLEKVQALLSDDATILEYFVAGDTILAAILTKASLAIQPVSTMSRVSPMLQFFRFQMGKAQLDHESASSPRMLQPAVAHLRELYDELVRPVRRQLKTDHLVVVPHGILHSLPFHSLHDGVAFLLDTFAVSYAPSSTLFTLCHVPHGKPGEGALILGVPDARAPHIKGEVEAIRQVLPESQLFLGSAANHELFLSKAPSRGVIHIATHGIFRPDNPMFSGIRLGDGYLQLYELYHMKLSADLLALSGCATGLNVVAEGDELLGLMRGFLWAGARALLLSLWDVEDSSTTQLMTAFYRHVSASVPYPEAIRSAAKEVRERYPHPCFWAPFVLVGKALSREIALET